MKATKEILDALAARLAAVTWTPDGGTAEPAFQTVKLYDLTDIEAAFQELLVTKQRVCLVIYGGTRYPDAGEGAGQVARRRITDVTLLLSDRVVGKRQLAMFGGDDNPGAVKLLDRVIAELPGPLFDGLAEAVDCAPAQASVFDLEDLKKVHPSRVAAQLDLECEDTAAPVIPPIEELEQAAVPVFSPLASAGPFSGAQSVTITSATAGATIRYTTDGSQPTRTHGTVYAAPVEIAATTLLRAVAYKNGLSLSEETLGVFEIQTEPVYPASTPAITALAEGGGYADGSPYMVGFKFTLAAGIVVTDLGIYDANQNGLGSPAAPIGPLLVGIFDNAGVLLDWTSIGFFTGAEGGTLDGKFRYRTIKPLALEPGTYLCAAMAAPYGSGVAAEFDMGGVPTFAGDITLVDHYFDDGNFLNTQLPVDPTPFMQLMPPTLDSTTNLGGLALVLANFKYRDA